jgi:predicted phage terminase large subunit-like protein
MPNDKPFLKGYRILRIPIIDSSGRAAWPEIFPIEKIDELRETVGPRHFSSQMMLEFISEDRARLDPGALIFYDGEFDARTAQIKFAERRAQSEDVNSSKLENNKTSSELSTDNLPPLCALRSYNSITGVACYWDPSSAKDGADSSVCVIIFRDDKNRRAFIHDIKYLAAGDDDLHPFATQCGRILDFLTRHDQRNLAIEVNGIGNALPEILRGQALSRGRPLVIQKIVNRENKERRILDAIEPLLATGRLYAHERVRKTKLITEMEEWMPHAGANHDDGLDAVAGALRMQPIAVRPRGQMFLPLRAGTDFKV